MKSTRRAYLCMFASILFLGNLQTALADVARPTVSISPSGVIDAFSVACTGTNATALLIAGYPSFPYSVREYMRRPCIGGTVHFDSFDLGQYVISQGGAYPAWIQYFHNPFYLIVKDTTTLPAPDAPIYNQVVSLAEISEFDFNFSLLGQYDATYPTIAIGSSFSYDGTTWSFTPPVIPLPPEPIGDPNNLPANISPSGDVPRVSINCTVGHNYTLSLVHEDAAVVQYSYGVKERELCVDGTVSFAGFNINTLLTQVDPSWWSYIRTPIQYIIKDTTGIYDCNQYYCPAINFQSDSNNFDTSLYLASSTVWTTVGKGPVYDTTDHTTWFNANIPAPTGDSNVLFIPGIEASRLYRQSRPDEGAGEKKLWEPTNNQNVLDLFLDENGKQPATILPQYSIYTRDVLDKAYGVVGIYDSFLSMLEKMKSVDHTIADYSAVPYDWRLSIDDILNSGTKTGSNISYISPSVGEPYILSELRRLAASSKNGKVTIVAHSNGGLVAKALLKRLQDTNDPLLNKVDKVIFVAVPQVGTPDAVGALLHGLDLTLPTSFAPYFLSQNIARGFAQNAPVSYNLLPSKAYFTSVYTPVVTFDAGLTDWIGLYTNYVNSYSRLSNFLTGSYGRVDSTSSDLDNPDSLRQGLLLGANDWHSVLDNWQIPSNINVVEIAGWGVPTTVNGINYVKKGTGIKPEPTFTIDGDGTVVTPSALWTAGASITKYWFNIGKYNKDHPISTFGGLLAFNHANILDIDKLDDFVSGILTDSTSSSTDKYLSTSTPITVIDNTRLIYALHSPLTLNLYDNLGRHTGVSTTTGQVEEQIPGTYYTEFGDIKYIFTDTNTPSQIVMNGYDSGTFTFNVNELQDDTLVASTTFKDIPTTSNTKVNLNIAGDISTLSPMSVDENGDGISDYNLKPKQNGVVTIPIPLTLSTNPKTITLGNPIPDLTYTISGFVNGDTATTSDIVGKANCSTTASNTSPVGTYPVNCTIGTLSSNNYIFTKFIPSTLYILYRFDGFLQPINDTAHQVGQDLSVFKAGSTVPVKFQLKKADGTIIQATIAPQWLTPQKGGSMSSSVDESVYSDSATSGSDFKWDSTAKQYIYNWSTKGLASGYWYKISVKLDDSNVYSVTVGLK